MLIFSPSRSFFGRKTADHAGGMIRGFTLVELLVSVAIFALITATAIYKYASFDSHVLLKSAAYEIALAVREVQVYSLSQRGFTGGSVSDPFRVPYGVSFTPGSDSYEVFAYTGSQNLPRHYPSGDFTDLSTTTLKRGMKVTDICITTSANVYCHSTNTNTITRLDDTFIRPEFDSHFFVAGLPSGVQHKDVESVTIKVKSPLDSLVWDIDISLLGQVEVTAE